MRNILLRCLVLMPVLFCTTCSKSIVTTTANNPKDYCTANINGKYWAAGCTDLFSNCLRAEWSNQKKDFILSCMNNSSTEIAFFLYDSTGLKTGKFILNQDSVANGAWYTDYSKSFMYYYTTTPAYVGTVTIAFDSIHGQVSGTFHFQAKYQTDSEIVNVTNGSFSLPCEIH